MGALYTSMTISAERGRFIMDIFHRDLVAMMKGEKDEYIVKMLRHGIEYYTWEANSGGRMFSNEEYMLLIQLYRAELWERYELV